MERVAYVVAAGFLSPYLSGSLPYVRHHITVNKMCWVASLNKTVPSFVHLLSTQLYIYTILFTAVSITCVNFSGWFGFNIQSSPWSSHSDEFKLISIPITNLTVSSHIGGQEKKNLIMSGCGTQGHFNPPKYLICLGKTPPTSPPPPPEKTKLCWGSSKMVVFWG